MFTSPKLVLSFTLALGVSASLFAEVFTIDKVHSNAGFSVSHLTISKVRGRFQKFEGTWELEPNSQKLKKLNVTVDVTSIDTDNTDRDDHLRNEDFFDVKKHPTMTFRMVTYKETSPGKGKVIGQLTIRGKSQAVEINAEVSKVVANPFKKGKSKAGLSLTTVINRQDFGVGKKYADVKIGEKISLTVDLEGNN